MIDLDVQHMGVNKKGEKYYQWDAQEYERSSAAQQKWAHEMIPKLRLKGDEVLLDIGCGDGKVTAAIAARLPGGRVVGVDNSDDMISLARKRYHEASNPNLRFQKEDATKLPFHEEFDVVFSNAALHWIRDHLPVLNGVSRSLRPGGRIMLQMGGQGNASDVVALFHAHTNQRKWRLYFSNFEPPYAFYSSVEYRQWIRDVGLQPQRIELVPKDMTHEGRAGFEGWIKTTWIPYIETVPPDLRTAFMTEFADQYLERFPPDRADKVHVQMVRLEVEAVKAIP